MKAIRCFGNYVATTKTTTWKLNFRLGQTTKPNRLRFELFHSVERKRANLYHADDDDDGNSDGVWWRTDIALIVSMRMAVKTWINNEKYQLHINKYNMCHFLKIAYTRFGCCCCCCCYAVFRHALAGVFVREKTMIRCYQTAGCIDGMWVCLYAEHHPMSIIWSSSDTSFRGISISFSIFSLLLLSTFNAEAFNSKKPLEQQQQQQQNVGTFIRLLVYA